MRLIYVLGKTSTGKSSLCRLLAKELGYDRISSDATRAALGVPVWHSSGPLVWRVMMQAIMWHIVEQRSLIVETTGMSPTTQALMHYTVPKIVILLTCEDEMRAFRERTRVDRERVPDIVFDMPLIDIKPDIEIDTTWLTRSDTAAKVIDQIYGFHNQTPDEATR